MPDLSRRIDRAEIMDTIAVPRPVMEETLEFLELTNRRFGGERVILRALDVWSATWPSDRAIRILDVGTGAADIPLAIARWARARRRSVKIRAIDLVPDIVDIAKQRTAGWSEISVAEANVFDLVKSRETYDYVIASLFLHHVKPQDTVHVLSSFDKLCTRGLIVSDLSRTYAGYWAVSALAMIAGNSVVRHDGPLSVRRAFRPDELNDLAAKAGLRYLKAAREPFFRLSLKGEKIHVA